MVFAFDGDSTITTFMPSQVLLAQISALERAAADEFVVPLGAKLGAENGRGLPHLSNHVEKTLARERARGKATCRPRAFRPIGLILHASLRRKTELRAPPSARH